jgi:hypothetical protein
LHLEATDNLRGANMKREMQKSLVIVKDRLGSDLTIPLVDIFGYPQEHRKL